MSPTVRASFELLGAQPGASEQDLKKAYHRLALIYHPDRQPVTESSNEASVEISSREFQKVTDAYKLLLDPTRVFELNRKHVREKLYRPVIEGIEITFGSFFGYRLFDPMKADGLRSLKIAGRTKVSGPGEPESFAWIPIEESSSVLDNPAYDAIEAVYAGRLSSEDDDRLKGETQSKRLVQLPWVVLNNQGILRFFESDLKGAKKCYSELCERIPNNILFTYRLGLCLILEAFKTPRRTLLGSTKPDRIKIEKGILLLRHCLNLGAERSVGRQKCLVIRKTLADVLERLGRNREARALWRDVFREDPTCAEAALRVKGKEVAIDIIQRKSRHDKVASLGKALTQLSAGKAKKRK
jgi:hypothetical protein